MPPSSASSASLALALSSAASPWRRRARAAPPRALAAAAAPLVAWLLHAWIDWDWQMPAVTLPALVLAGLLIVLAANQEDEPPDLAPPPAV